MNFNHILLTTDLSDPVISVFEYTAYQAKMSGAKVTLIHVVPPFHVPPELNRVVWNPERWHDMENEYIKTAREQLEALAGKHMHEQEVNVVSLVSNESVGRTIAEYAKQEKADLIVMAGHGRGVVGQLLLGSTVQKVLAAAPCPVMVMPAASGQASEEQ